MNENLYRRKKIAAWSLKSAIIIMIIPLLISLFSTPPALYCQFGGDQFSSAEPSVTAEAKYQDGFILFKFDLDNNHHITDLDNGFFTITTPANDSIEILGSLFPKGEPYQDEIVFKGQFEVKVYIKSLKPLSTPFNLKFNVSYQICQERPEEVCFPPSSKEIELTINDSFKENKLPENALAPSKKTDEEKKSSTTPLPELKDLSKDPAATTPPFLKKSDWPVFGLIALLLIFLAIFLGMFKPLEDDNIAAKFAKAGLLLIFITGAFLFLKAFQFSRENPKLHLNWIYDIEQGKAIAKKENKPILFDASADWCVACQKLEEQTFSDREVYKFLENYVLVKVDYTQDNDANRAFRTEMKFVGLPTVIFLDTEGKETHRFSGFIDKDSFFTLMGQKEAGWFDRQVNLLKEELEKKSFLVFGLIFLLGFLTSLTPCVYPVIPIVMGYIGTRSGKNKMRGFYLSIFFVIGLSIVYSILGVVAGLSGSMIGSSFQSPIVVLVISGIFILMGLSMAGLFEIPVPTSISSKIQGGGGKSQVFGAILIGGVAAIIAAPCVGPVLIALLTWIGETRDAFLGFLLTFTFSLGMGVLFIIVGTFSGAISAMPKGGKWMNYIKYFFATLLVAGGIVTLTNITPTWLSYLLWGIFLLALSVFTGFYKHPEEENDTIKRKLFQLVMVLVFLLGIWMFIQSIETQFFTSQPLKAQTEITVPQN